MPICGYLVYPVEGKTEGLRRILESIPGCEVHPADNRDVLVLVTDTPDDEHEAALQEKLKEVPFLQCIALTYGAMDPGPERNVTPC